MNHADGIAVLLSSDLSPGPVIGWHIQPGPVRDLLERLRQLAGEAALMGGRPEIEPATYLTAIHALVLDLIEMTGAQTNGRRHPAHDELLESVEVMWS